MTVSFEAAVHQVGPFTEAVEFLLEENQTLRKVQVPVQGVGHDPEATDQGSGTP